MEGIDKDDLPLLRAMPAWECWHRHEDDDCFPAMPDLDLCEESWCQHVICCPVPTASSDCYISME